ncbi:SUMO-specific isopeptidase USPL1 [Polymixia lowei]
MVQEGGASLEKCPWCASKDLTYALRSYRINFKESIILCTSPRCLFHLVSRPLEDVLASLVPAEPGVGGKRKNTLLLESEEVVSPSPKRRRSDGDEGPTLQSAAGTTVPQADPADVELVGNGRLRAPEAEAEKVNEYREDYFARPVTEIAEQETPRNETEKASGDVGSTDGLTPSKAAYPVKKDDRGGIPTATPAAAEATLASAGHPPCSSEDLLSADGDASAVSPPRHALHTSEVKDKRASDMEFTQGKRPHEEVCGPSNQGTDRHSFPDEGIDPIEKDTLPPQLDEQPAEMEPTADSNVISTFEEQVRIKPDPEDFFPPKKRRGPEKDEGDIPPHPEMMTDEPEELVSVPPQLFWRNTDALCWLDALLIALVNCESLRRSKPKDEPRQSSVWGLITKYDEVCVAVQAHQQTGTDGVVRVPNRVLREANSELQSLRMSIFKLLQPKLQCQLGKRETPVFAMPLLLMTDSWADPLFQLTFHWEFECSDCRSTNNHRDTKALPTFTNIVADWHPLHAAHLAPCNVCCMKNQTRTMVLERVPLVLALHFVEGLPDNDVRIYSFNFQGKRYSVTTVIQYDQRLKHFVTWIRKSDGSWQEFDDLKHPDCPTHVKLPVLAQDIHIVFWEREMDKERNHACSPMTTVGEYPLSNSELSHRLTDKDFTADKSLAPSPDQSLLTLHNDTDIIGALTVFDDSGSALDTMEMAGADASIGSMTLLDTFEGLTHNDIVTLTLVECKVDLERRPLNDDKQTPEMSLSNRSEVVECSLSPDTSSTVKSSVMPCDSVDELPSTTDVSDTDTVNNSSSDPTYVPGSRRGRGKARGSNKGRGKGRWARSAKAAPATLQSASVDNTEIILPTLVEVKVDSERRPLNDDKQTPEMSLSSRSKVVECSPSPDTSSSVKSSEMPLESVDGLTPTPNISDMDNVNNSSSDPMCVPGSRRERGQGKGRRKGRRGGLAKAAPAAAKTNSEIILPTLVGAAVPTDVPLEAVSLETTQQTSSVSSTKTSPPTNSQRSPEPPETLSHNDRWSYLLSRHPLSNAHASITECSPAHKPTPTTVVQVKPTSLTHSTPNPVRRPKTPVGPFPKPQLRCETSEALPLKAAEMYSSFRVNSTNNSTPPQTPPLPQLPQQKMAPTAFRNDKSNAYQSITPVSQKPPINIGLVSNTSLSSRATERLKISSKTHSSSSMKVPSGVNDTDVLRHKLLKKLKAKKKKLEKIDQQLGHQQGAGWETTPRPDSTELSSFQTVSSSTYESAACNGFLANLLSPATTSSSLSPDSTGLLERLTNGREGGDHVDCGGSTTGGELLVNNAVNDPLISDNDNFMEEFFPGVSAQQQTETEMEALSALELLLQ